MQPSLRIVLNVMTATTTLTLCLAVLTLYLIVSKTPRIMHTCRFYFVCYIVFGITAELLMACMKPIPLDPLVMIYSAGWLSTISREAFVVEFALLAVFVYNTFVCYFTIVFDRILAMTLVRRREQVLFCVFCGMAVAGSLVIVAFVVCANLDYYPSTAEIHAMIRNNVENGEALIVAGNALYVVDALQLSTTTWTLAGVGIAFLSLAGSAPLLLIAFMVIRRNKNSYLTARYRQLNLMLLRASLAQLFGCFVLAFGPMLVFFLLRLAEVSFRVGQYSIMVINGFMLFDMSFLIVSIRPYREAVLTLLRTKQIQTSFLHSSGPVYPIATVGSEGAAVKDRRSLLKFAFGT